MYVCMHVFTDATLQASDVVLGDGFGKAVSLSKGGIWAIATVGAPYRDEGGVTDKGAVYVFKFSLGQWSYHSRSCFLNSSEICPEEISLNLLSVNITLTSGLPRSVCM